MVQKPYEKKQESQSQLEGWKKDMSSREKVRVLTQEKEAYQQLCSQSGHLEFQRHKDQNHPGGNF